MEYTETYPTEPGMYWLKDALVMRNLGVRLPGLVKVFYVQEYEEYDTEPTLCVGVRGWNESIKSFKWRHKSVQPKWIGPVEVPQ